MSKFGRYQVAEPPSKLACLHFHQGGTLKPVDYEPPIDVLDQEDLDTQGIDVSTFIPGAQPGITALGSCTANTFIERASRALPAAEFIKLVASLTGITLTPDTIYTDTVTLEKAAINFYFLCTHQTGDPSQEWPPTDCGSTGLYVFNMAKTLGVIASEKIAHGADNIVSLFQQGSLIVGTPYLNDWMEPDAAGFIDGNGRLSTLEAQIKDGVAGGHEIHFSAIEKLALTRTGKVDPFKTVIRWRNHWRRSWGDNGSGRVHLSTIVALGGQVDLRLLIAPNSFL